MAQTHENEVSGETSPERGSQAQASPGHASPEQAAPTKTPRAARADKAPSAPRDRFEAPSKQRRVGAHRVVGKPKRFWIYLVSALAGIVVLTGAGIIALQLSNAATDARNSEEMSKAPERVNPELDPEAAVVVLNGTSMPGFGAIVDGLITENGWGQILFSAEAAVNDIEKTTLYYSSVSDEAMALGLAEQLGISAIAQSYEYADYGAQLIVVLGADYTGPGSDQFVPGEPGETADESGEDPGTGDAPAEEPVE